MRIRFNKSIIFSLFVIAVFIEPPIFTILSSFSWINSIYNVLKIICIVIILGFVFSSKTRIKDVFSIIMMISMIWAIQIFSTIVYSGNLKSALLSYVIILCLVLWFHFQIKINWLSVAKIISCYFSVLTVINLYLQIKYPSGAFVFQGWRDESINWLFGNKNSAVPIILPAIIFSFLVYIHNKKTLYLIFCLVGIISIAYCDSSTAIVGLFVFLFLQFLLFLKLIKNKPLPSPKILNMNSYMFGAFAVTVLLIVLNEVSSFSFLIVDLLGRDLTFTSRTSIWARFLAESMTKPFTGFGVKYISDIRNQFNTSHQHDYYLHLLYQGGFFSLFAFVYLINVCRKKLILTTNTKNSYILSAGLFSFLIMFITEVYGDSLYILPFYIIVIFALDIDYVYDNREIKEMIK